MLSLNFDDMTINVIKHCYQEDSDYNGDGWLNLYYGMLDGNGWGNGDESAGEDGNGFGDFADIFGDGKGFGEDGFLDGDGGYV